MRTTLVAVAGLLLCSLAWTGVEAAGPLDERGAVKAVTCTACHGQGGNSRSSAMPTIAGLDPAYFKKQIENYAAGKRPSPEMEPYAKQVLQLGVDDIAAYFGAQKRAPTGARLDAAAVERGRAASRQCAVCHGDRGEGDRAKLIPDLRGQPPGYLRHQMLLFKADKRLPGDERLKVVKVLMKTIPDETFADLAAYFASQR